MYIYMECVAKGLHGTYVIMLMIIEALKGNIIRVFQYLFENRLKSTAFGKTSRLRVKQIEK